MKVLDPAIDSFTAITPVEKFDIVPNSMFDEYAVLNLDTGEYVDCPRKPVFHEKNGIKVRCALVSLFGKQHLSITYNSKMLVVDSEGFEANERAYFGGIHSGSFRRAYTYAKKIIGFEIPYSRYLTETKVFDCDFKFDFHSFRFDFHNYLKPLADLPGTRKYYDDGTVLDDRCIDGLQFVSRDDSSISKPFVKFYSKGKQLESDPFKRFYMTGFFSNTLRRLEGTVKSRKHFDSFKLGNRLEDILSINSSKCYDIVCDLLSRHSDQLVAFEPGEKKHTDFLTPTDFFLGKMALSLINCGYNFRSVLALYADHESYSSVNKSRIKKRLKVALHFLRSRDLDAVNLKIQPKDAFIL